MYYSIKYIYIYSIYSIVYSINALLLMLAHNNQTVFNYLCRKRVYQIFRREVGQSLVDEGGLLVTHHVLPSPVTHHQLRPHRSLAALLQRHLQAEDKVIRTETNTH